MLLISEGLFHLNNVNVNLKNRHLLQVHGWGLNKSNKHVMTANPNIVGSQVSGLKFYWHNVRSIKLIWN